MKNIVKLMALVSLIGGLGVAINNGNNVVETNAISSDYEIVTDYNSLSTGDKIVIYDTLYGYGVTGLGSNGCAAVSKTESQFKQYVVTMVSNGFTLYDESVGKYLSATNFASDYSTASFTYASTGATCSFSNKRFGLSFSNIQYGVAFILGHMSTDTNYTFYNANKTGPLAMYAYKLKDSVTAKEWASKFLSQTKSACNNPDDNNYEALSKVWTTLKTSYTSLTSNVKNAIKNGTDATITEAMARYKHIINRYTQIEDFIYGRTATTSASNIINRSNDSNTMIMMVTLISFVAMSSIGGYMVIRKKRQ